jgi:hypothetical protein
LQSHGNASKTNDWRLAPFLPALPPFIREVHRGCGGREVSTRKKEKKKRRRDVVLIFVLYIFYFKEESTPICMD